MKQQKIQQQTGSAHVVIVVILVIALVGALGFIFYQNFIAKKASTTTSQTSNTTQQSANNTNTTKAVAKKEYCTELEKICFSYPEDWSVTARTAMGTLSSTTPTMDQVQIANKSGEVYLYISTGISGIGGSCSPAETQENTILGTHTTNITGSYLQRELPQNFGTTAYAITYVGPTQLGSSMYEAGMYIMAEKAVTNPGKVNACYMNYNMFASKSDNGSVRFGTTGFATTGETKQRTFSSYDEAVAFLNTDDAKTAFDILVSAYYK